MRRILTLVLLLLAGSASGADYLLVLDSTRLDRAVAGRGTGPDGRPIRPGVVTRACRRDGVFGPAAFSPKRGTCRSVATVPGLSEALIGLQLDKGEINVTVLNQIDAGGIVAVLPSRRLACTPGECSREVFEDASYPTNLVGRPAPDPLPAPSIAEFEAQPAVMPVGQTATLSWAATEVAGCQLESSEETGALNVSPSGQMQVLPAEDTVWTLTCAGPGGTAIKQAAVSVTPAPGSPTILLFTATSVDVPVGARTRLTWEAQDATTCEISDGEQFLAVAVRGRLRVPVTADTLFELRCQSPAGSVTSTTEVLVTTAAQAPIIESFSIDRSAIKRGDNAFLRWDAPQATRCRLRESSQGVSWRLPPQGQFKLIPAASSDYTLDCRNAYGLDTAQTTIKVEDSAEPLRILAFGFEALGVPASRGVAGRAVRLARPGLIELSWATEGARACRIADDRGRSFGIPLTGSRIIRVEETTAMQINCAARGAEAQTFGQVEVIEELLFADDFEN